MKKIFLLFTLIFVVKNFADAQHSLTSNANFSNSLQSPKTLTSEQIHRIGDYGKLWYVLNLFHPEMAYGKINADSLFTNNIGDLLNEPSAENFKKSVQNMINELHDPYTTIQEKKNATDSVQLPKRSLLKWLDDSVALVYFDDEFMRENTNPFYNPTLLSLIDTLKHATGIILDLRKTSLNEGDYYSSDFMKQFIGYITFQNISYPSFRSRIHYGHESESLDISSFYYQGWFLQNGLVVYKKQKSIHKPICLLINRFNNNISDAIATLQQNGIAKVIADDSLRNFEPAATYPMILADSLKVNVRLSKAIYANGNKNFSPDTIIYHTSSKTEGAIISTAIHFLKNNWKEKVSAAQTLQNIFATPKVEGYDSLAYPPAALRLLGLLRYWSAIEYFCPNKDRITKNWDSVLYEYVPKLLNAKDSLDYNFIVARLIKEINDTHGFFGSAVFRRLIAKTPEVQLKYVEHKTILYKIYNDSLRRNISIGDEIIAVDGIPIKQLRESIAQYIGASTNASLQRDISERVLSGKLNTSVKINFIHNGNHTTLTLPRKDRAYDLYKLKEGTVFKKINDKIGYVDFGRLQVTQIDSMFNELKKTNAIILDDRSYPNGTVWTLVNYLTDKTVTIAKGTTMIADSPDTATITMQDQLWQIPVTPQPLKYTGRIIILVNETTQSQAEYSCMVLQAAYKKVTIVGSQTAGADGDVTGIKIPGGITTAFSGHGIHYPDGRATQGIGIVPNIKISPTIKGIKEGKDEVLERAIEFAKTGK